MSNAQNNNIDKGSVDYHTHPMYNGRPGKQRNFSVTTLRDFAGMARKMGITHLAFTDHRFVSNLDFTPVDSVANFFQDIQLAKGLEYGYQPGKEQEVEEEISNLGLDFAIGVVQSLGNDEDIKDFKQKWSIQKVYDAYFERVRESAACGIFDVIGHMDFVKKFYKNPPVEDEFLRDLVRPVLEEIKKQGMVVEVNTGGLNTCTPSEMHPGEVILKDCFELGIPVTTGSDAHQVYRVGEYIQRAEELLSAIGYRQVAVFSERKMSFVEI